MNIGDAAKACGVSAKIFRCDDPLTLPPLAAARPKERGGIARLTAPHMAFTPE
ncbi:MAG TPA: hypothetical protein PKB14_00575 [Rubrivivax sp.]|nr:hypothetical protein [Rubrivivax sp.]